MYLARSNKPMKSENQISIVRCEQPIKVEKPLQCLFTFSYTSLVKEIFLRLFCDLFSVFIFSPLSEVIITEIEFMFLGITIFWALLRAHFNSRLTARVKMRLSRAQNIFIPVNINSIVLLY